MSIHLVESAAGRSHSRLGVQATLLAVTVFSSASAFANFALPPWAEQLCVGYTSSTQSTSTSTSSATVGVLTNTSTAIQTQTIRVGESLAVSSSPSHGTATVSGSGDTVNYVSTVGYSGVDSVVTQFTSLGVNCQAIYIDDVYLGKNLNLNQNIDTKTITINVAASNTQAIPTLSEWSMILLSGLMALFGMRQLTRIRPR